MERILPTYTIEGTEFIVDVARNEIRQENNAFNCISFEDMQLEGNRYIFPYDLVTLNIAKQNNWYNVEVTIPQKVYLDPEGMAALHHLTPAELRGKTDAELELLQLQIQHAAPSIDIAGHKYFVLVESRQLLPDRPPFNCIDLAALEVDAGNEFYTAFYHTPSRQVVPIDRDTITRMPKDVVAIWIPLDYRLDPIGFAEKMREEGVKLNMEVLLKVFPPEKELKAKVLPLSQTDLPEVIRKNKLNNGNNQRPGQRP